MKMNSYPHAFRNNLQQHSGLLERIEISQINPEPRAKQRGAHAYAQGRWPHLGLNNMPEFRQRIRKDRMDSFSDGCTGWPEFPRPIQDNPFSRKPTFQRMAGFDLADTFGVEALTKGPSQIMPFRSGFHTVTHLDRRIV